MNTQGKHGLTDNPIGYRTTQEVEGLITMLSAYMRGSLAGQPRWSPVSQDPFLGLMSKLADNNDAFSAALRQHHEAATFDSLEAVHQAAGQLAADLAVLCERLRSQHQWKRTQTGG